MHNETMISAYSAFLEFYSSRAEAHASFFMASLFGLYAIFTIVQSKKSDNKITLWNIPAIGLMIMNIYCLINFHYYASNAYKSYMIIDKYTDAHAELLGFAQTKLYWFWVFKVRIFVGIYKLIIFTVGYFFIAIVPYFLTFKNNTIIHLIKNKLSILFSKLDC